MRNNRTYATFFMLIKHNVRHYCDYCRSLHYTHLFNSDRVCRALFSRLSLLYIISEVFFLLLSLLQIFLEVSM